MLVPMTTMVIAPLVKSQTIHLLHFGRIVCYRRSLSWSSIQHSKSSVLFTRTIVLLSSLVVLSCQISSARNALNLERQTNGSEVNIAYSIVARSVFPLIVVQNIKCSQQHSSPPKLYPESSLKSLWTAEVHTVQSIYCIPSTRYRLPSCMST